MTTETAITTEVTLSKADQKKLLTFGFHTPLDASEYGDDQQENWAGISIFQYVLNAKGDGLKNARVGSVRFRRFTTAFAIKRARALVKDLNAGVEIEGLFPPCRVVSVPTGRPRGRRPSTEG